MKPRPRRAGGPNRRWISIRGIDPGEFRSPSRLVSDSRRGLSKEIRRSWWGNLVRLKLGNLQIGDSIPTGRQMHKVVGFFTAGGSAFEERDYG